MNVVTFHAFYMLLAIICVFVGTLCALLVHEKFIKKG